MAAVALDIPNPWQTTPEEDALIKQKLLDIKPNVLTYWTDASELSQMMASGDVWVAASVWTDTYSQRWRTASGRICRSAEGGWWVCGYGISNNTGGPGLHVSGRSWIGIQRQSEQPVLTAHLIARRLNWRTRLWSAC